MSVIKVSLAELMAQKQCTGVAFTFCQFKNFLHMICMVNLNSTSFSVICFRYRSDICQVFTAACLSFPFFRDVLLVSHIERI